MLKISTGWIFTLKSSHFRSRNSCFRYLDLVASSSSPEEGETEEEQLKRSSFGNLCSANISQGSSGLGRCDGESQLLDEEFSPTVGDLSSYQYVFIAAQILHGIGAVALITLGVNLMDESVSKSAAPMYIGIFEASFVLGPALG